MNYTIPTVPEVIVFQWPDVQFTYERGQLTYPNGHIGLDTSSIESATFTLTKLMCEESIRMHALDAVSIISKIAIGTDDMRQLYIYDIKRDESLYLKTSGMLDELSDINTTNDRKNEISSTCRLLSREAADLGIPLSHLAVAVLDQFKLSNDFLHDHLGRIEGIRRHTLTLVAEAQNFHDLDTIPEPQWILPDTIIPF